jgi:hypothetical protein
MLFSCKLNPILAIAESSLRHSLPAAIGLARTTAKAIEKLLESL